METTYHSIEEDRDTAVMPSAAVRKFAFVAVVLLRFATGRGLGTGKTGRRSVRSNR
jgi:hypothetical protein